MHKTPALFKPLPASSSGAVPEPTGPALKDLAEPRQDFASQAQTAGTRTLAEHAGVASMDIARALRALRCAKDLTDPAYFIDAAMELLRRDPHLRALLQTRVLGITSLRFALEATGDSRLEKKALEEALRIVQSDPVEAALPSMVLSGVYLGSGVFQLFSERTDGRRALVGLREVPPRFLTYDKTTFEPLLLPKEQGGQATPLDPAHFMHLSMNLISGNPLAGSIAYTVLVHAVLKGLILTGGWTRYAELFGQPTRVGKYPMGMAANEQGKKDLAVLKKALQNLGGDAWAMLPQEMQIEFVEAAGRGASADVYERLCRYLDEQLAKLILGGSLTSGTGNMGTGGSMALGRVHNELRRDIQEADAKRLASAVRRGLVSKFVGWNVSPLVGAPLVFMPLDNPVDISAKVKALGDMMDRGLVVPAAEIYALLDVRAPDEVETVIGGQRAAPAQNETPNKPQSKPAKPPKEEKGTALTAAQAFAIQADELDALGAEILAEDETEDAQKSVAEVLLSALEKASTFEELKAALLEAALSSEGMLAPMARATTAARAAGETGFVVGGE